MRYIFFAPPNTQRVTRNPSSIYYYRRIHRNWKAISDNQRIEVDFLNLRVCEAQLPDAHQYVCQDIAVHRCKTPKPI
jgi:hypothetical protein